MASAKSRRYGQGGFSHKHTLNVNRPNGKAWKKYPKAFNWNTRSLITVGQDSKGLADTYI